MPELRREVVVHASGSCRALRVLRRRSWPNQSLLIRSWRRKECCRSACRTRTRATICASGCRHFGLRRAGSNSSRNRKRYTGSTFRFGSTTQTPRLNTSDSVAITIGRLKRTRNRCAGTAGAAHAAGPAHSLVRRVRNGSRLVWRSVSARDNFAAIRTRRGARAVGSRRSARSTILRFSPGSKRSVIRSISSRDLNARRI